MNEEQAKKHIKELRGFYCHLGSFIGVNLFLFVINVATGGEMWFIYPLFGWGIGLIAHAFHVYGGGWEARKMQELTGWTDTRSELERLSERTENLITILASVDWSKIDPELRETRDNLLRAHRSLAGKQDGEERLDKDEVRREIEKLEAFVTSSRFDYYDRAARDPD